MSHLAGATISEHEIDAHRLSTYEKYGIKQGAEVGGRGIISTQFILTDAGWKISSMAWDDERPGLTLPDRYRK